ncbi:hypothetical protein [Tenacibaculum piscium]|uniref:hypothetical protein n=1 Tax=Tenacibaculum piscium TaxID=1458515 RepID=UPI001F41FFBE|nr:hypothetical protein [Tenacibaculum piscium]
MAIIQSILMSRASGSIGNLTLATVKGRVIAKEKATIVSNPRTELQVKQRLAMSRTVHAWQMLHQAVKRGNTVFGKYSNPYAGFISNNIDLFKTIDKEPKELVNSDFVGVQATKGKYQPLTYSFEKIENLDAVLTVGFSSIGGDVKENDKVVLVFGSKGSNKVSRVSVEIGALTDGQVSKQLAFKTDRRPIDPNTIVAIYYVSADGRESSNSFIKLGS